MIYFKSKALFIHIPRTSGVAITQAVMHNYRALRDEAPLIVAGSSIGGITRHATGYALKVLVSDFHCIEKVAVIRNPWRMCESTYRYFKLYPDVYKWAHMEFGEFVLQHYQFLNCGGFWKHWCHDWENGLEYGVRPFRFEDLDDPTIWGELCRILQIPDAKREQFNAGEDIPVEWNDASVDFIRRVCEFDFLRFGYPDVPM